jgi:DNA-binding PadR family transcriptional regulator
MVISNTKRPRPAQSVEPATQVTPAIFQIMLALVDGDSHGYGIMQDVERITKGAARLGPGTLYRSIQRMLVEELIEELEIALFNESDDDRRRYYRLTRKGRAVAKAEAQRLADLVDAARERNLIKRGGKGERS